LRAGDATGLTARVAHPPGNPAAGRPLSGRSLVALVKLHCPVNWGQVIERFLRNAPAGQDWLDAITLAATHGPLLQASNPLSDE
jgi:hypothetical protein